ncbi:DUF4280 domain-containing protein [Apibacter adventoris]|uniref:DUF4280 domain-containing protein n=1 Tax=Apibacter adventoris TaxID=1679466 RepID=A0A2S8AE36_9FLAO|nr:DUF4280 domain-containing protein [Apibacter adventoris]PQL93225.1 DUF4280 domain-containing protein [Apibacter adventoris]
MGVKYIVQGAVCSCLYGSGTDALKVKTQSKVFLNDMDGAKKLAVTTTDLGTTFEKNCFGSCAKKKNNPCTVTLTAWSGEETKKKIVGAGNLLTEESKATCPVGGKDCISILYHGQQAEVSPQNFSNTDPQVQAQINPLVDTAHLGRNLKPSPQLKAK